MEFWRLERHLLSRLVPRSTDWYPNNESQNLGLTLSSRQKAVWLCEKQILQGNMIINVVVEKICPWSAAFWWPGAQEIYTGNDESVIIPSVLSRDDYARVDTEKYEWDRDGEKNNCNCSKPWPSIRYSETFAEWGMGRMYDWWCK